MKKLQYHSLVHSTTSVSGGYMSASTINKNDDREIVKQLKKSHDDLVNEIGNVIIGQRQIID